MGGESQREEAVEYECLVVPLPDAVAHPGAVMVVNRDAAVADTAVVYSRRFNDLTGRALFAVYFVFSLYLVLPCALPPAVGACRFFY